MSKFKLKPESKKDLEAVTKKINRLHVELNAQRRIFKEIRSGGGSSEFEWPVDELLRQLKIKLETDVGEIQRYVTVMHRYNERIVQIQSMQAALKEKIESSIDSGVQLARKLEQAWLKADEELDKIFENRKKKALEEKLKKQKDE